MSSVESISLHNKRHVFFQVFTIYLLNHLAVHDATDVGYSKDRTYELAVLFRESLAIVLPQNEWHWSSEPDG